MAFETVDLLLVASCCAGLAFAICLLYITLEYIRNIYKDGVEWP